MSAKTHVKAELDGLLRRFSISAEPSFADLTSACIRSFSLNRSAVFGDSRPDFLIEYVDEDGDYVLVSSNQELREAIDLQQSSDDRKVILRIRLTRVGSNEALTQPARAFGENAGGFGDPSFTSDADNSFADPAAMPFPPPWAHPVHGPPHAYGHGPPPPPPHHHRYGPPPSHRHHGPPPHSHEPFLFSHAERPEDGNADMQGPPPSGAYLPHGRFGAGMCGSAKHVASGGPPLPDHQSENDSCSHGASVAESGMPPMRRCGRRCGRERGPARWERWCRFAQQIFPGALPQRAAENAGPCRGDLGARFVEDVSISPGTKVEPGAALIKTWRIRNDGGEAWPINTCLEFVSGDRMGAPSAIVVPVAAAGESVLASVLLEAPAEAGRYCSQWRLCAPDGRRFGQRFRVDVTVVSGASSESDTPDGSGALPDEEEMWHAAQSFLRTALGELSPHGVHIVAQGTFEPLMELSGLFQRFVCRSILRGRTDAQSREQQVHRLVVAAMDAMESSRLCDTLRSHAMDGSDPSSILMESLRSILDSLFVTCTEENPDLGSESEQHARIVEWFSGSVMAVVNGLANSLRGGREDLYGILMSQTCRIRGPFVFLWPAIVSAVVHVGSASEEQGGAGSAHPSEPEEHNRTQRVPDTTDTEGAHDVLARDGTGAHEDTQAACERNSMPVASFSADDGSNTSSAQAGQRYAPELARLEEMGFRTTREQNIELLDQYNGDFDKVVNQLLQSESWVFPEDD